MAALAFVVALIFAQSGTNNAASSPFDGEDPACNPNCGCDFLGLAYNTSASSLTVASNEFRECCNYPAEDLCVDWGPWGNGECGAGTITDMSKLSTPKGTTPATTCCKPVTATCADVTCTSRRRSGPDGLKLTDKSGVATTACTSQDDCETKCCEMKTDICIVANQAWMCETGKRKKTMYTYQCVEDDDGVYTATTAAALAAATETEYQTNCCEAKPACPTAPNCPADMEVDATKTEYSWGEEECCKLKATACENWGGTSSVCTGNWNSQGSGGCTGTYTEICDAPGCGTDKVLNRDAVFATTDTTDALKKAACCISPSSSGSSSTKTCASWKTDVEAAAAKKSAGSTSGAQFNVVSMAVLVVLAFMTMFVL